MSPSALRCSQCRSGWRASGSRRSEGAQIARWSKPDAWFSRRVPGVDPLQSLELPRFHRASSSAALWSTSVPFRVRPVFPIGSAEPSANDLIERTGDRMRRREFIGLVGGAAASPLAAAAQAPERSFRIGWLGNTDAREWAEWRGREFREGLRDLGYIEGKNLRFELRFAEGDHSRLPALAGELAALNVDVIVTHGGGVFAARQTTSTIPIVFAAGAAEGLVSSLAHPGGNISGSTFFSEELLAKRLEMLEEIAPSLARAGLLLLRAKFPAARSQMTLMIETVRAAAEALKIEVFPIEVNGPEEFESAFATWDEKRIGGLIISDDAQFNTNSAAGAIAALAAARRLPTVGRLELARPADSSAMAST